LKVNPFHELVVSLPMTDVVTCIEFAAINNCRIQLPTLVEPH
jgi:hypothetical protein